MSGSLKSDTGSDAEFRIQGARSRRSAAGRACNKLNLSNYIGIIAQDAANRVTALGVAAGRSPLSITGACIYLIAHLMGQPRTPKEIGLAVDVSDGTIRTAYKLIYNARDTVIEEEWIRKGGDRSKIPVG